MSKLIKKYHFIYKTTNLLNDTFYIGMHSTCDLNDGYLGSGKRLKYAIKKYGAENFQREILEYLPDREMLVNREKEIINEELLKNDKCLNLMLGGKGGFVSVEQQAYRSKCANEAFRKKLKEDEEFRHKISKNNSKVMKKNHLDGKMRYDTFIGKKHTDATKQKMSEKAHLKTGEKNSQFGTIWINNGFENKKIKKELLGEYTEWVVGRLPIGNVGKNQFNKN